MTRKMKAAAIPPAESALKYDGGKPDMSLLSGIAIEQLSMVLTFGAQKYSANNWRKGFAITRLLSACLRHIFAMMRGEMLDPETGLHHAAHAMCNCMFIIELCTLKPELNDIYFKEKDRA